MTQKMKKISHYIADKMESEQNMETCDHRMVSFKHAFVNLFALILAS